jgi:hypothetical protein
MEKVIYVLMKTTVENENLSKTSDESRISDFKTSFSAVLLLGHRQTDRQTRTL